MENLTLELIKNGGLAVTVIVLFKIINLLIDFINQEREELKEIIKNNQEVINNNTIAFTKCTEKIDTITSFIYKKINK